jgi:hypothetical protein
MKTTEQLKLLPKIEVSFQDDFSGDERELVLTPKYILHKLEEAGFKAKTGDEILLWEKDHDNRSEEYYMCNIGKIVKADKYILQNFPNSILLYKKLVRLDNKPVIVNIDTKEYFNLPKQNPVFN